MRTGLLAVCLAMSATAHAEGTSTLGATQKLRSGVELYVDIVDSSVERITWTGVGNVAVTGPLGAVYGNYSSGQTIVPASGNGAYKLVPQSNQSESVPWEITVDNQTTAGGRLWSYTWQFNNGSFAPSHSTFASYYAVVPAGGSGETTVIELELEGLSGYWFDVAANRIGVTGEEGGKSVPMSGNSVWPEFPIYLAPPTNATYSRVNPMAEGFWLNGGGSTSVLDGSMIECNQFDPGVSGLAFYFETDVDGTFNVQCDLDQDGQYERTDSIDLLLIGTSEPGWNTVPWSGNDNDGNPVAEGTYNCRLQVNVGEFHYVGTDIESSYEGMRLFEVGSGGTRSPLTMYWDDSLVQYKAQNMPNGAVGLESSGNSGVSPGSYFAATVPNVNARSWGNFNSGGKGNESYLDTYTFAGSTVGVVITMEAVDGTVDTDGDGISDYEEACWYGTDPNESDSDGNGTPDGSQYGAGASSGGGGGLESNGRLQQALARRDLQRSFRAPVLAMRPPPSDLDGLVPWEGPRGSTPYEVSPYDLTQYTNAETVRAWDFVDPDGETVGAVMVFETTGEIYEHTKAICDRSGGSEVLGVTERSLGKGAYVTASYANAADNTHEHGTTVMLYDQGTVEREGETVDLGYLATSRWLMAEYPRPQADQKVLELQVWTASPRDQAGLLDAVLEAIGETRPIAWQDATRAPEAWFRAASKMGGALELDVANPLDLDYRLLATFTDERGVHSTLELPVTDGPVRLPLFQDAMVDLLVDGQVRDKVWLSDGIWVPMHDGLFGGGTVEHGFSNTDCIVERDAVAGTLRLSEGLPLSGCATLDAEVDNYAGVARHLAAGAVDVRAWGDAVFYLQSDRDVSFCVESLEGQACAPVAAAPEGAWVSVDLDDLTWFGDVDPRADTRLVVVTSAEAGPFELTVAGLSFTDAPTWSLADAPEVAAPRGCQSAPVSMGGFALLALLGLRRRRA